VQLSPPSCMLSIFCVGGEWLMASLHIHRRNAKLDSDRRSLLRSLEVGSAISLFILWPRESIVQSQPLRKTSQSR
jgi:hypothetical protein